MAKAKRNRTPRRPDLREIDRTIAGKLSAIEGTDVVAVRTWAIRQSESRYGPRQRWGQLQYAQAAIVAIYPLGLPKNFNASKVTREVNHQLAGDPEYGALGLGEVSRQTVLRAVKALS